MSKKTFNSQEWLHLTEVAHAAVLSGLMAAKRWEPGEVKFQGGQVHGMQDTQEASDEQAHEERKHDTSR